MSFPDLSDSELLTEWLELRREHAFQALVARYAALVHATARRSCGDESMAAEVSQLTFIVLARKARSLTHCRSLGGWLHRTAVLQSRNLIRKTRGEERKRERLRNAMNADTEGGPNEAWKEIQPVLDEALGALSERDREAVLLRFYRVLSLREVADTLGIGVEAARKRVDRATERLREKLLRRGCEAGGSLSSVMLAGFAADAQAGVPAAAGLASKAIAAGVAGSGAVSATTAGLLAGSTKTTSLAAPLIAALLAGVLIAKQRSSISEWEERNARLERALAVGPGLVAGSPGRPASVTSALDRRPVDWAEVAKQLRSSRGSGYLQTGLVLQARLAEGFEAMGVGQLETSLDEIASAKLSAGDRNLLERTLGGLLLEKDPERGLDRFIARVHDEGSSPLSGQLAIELSRWAKQDPEGAVAWFDRQIAAGKFDSRYLSGSLHARIGFEHELVFALLSSNPSAAGGRLAAFPEEERIKLLQGVGAGRRIQTDESVQGSFAEMLREQLPDRDRLAVITWPVTDLGETGTIGYPELEGYLARIDAAPDEREACILAVAAQGRFARESGDCNISIPADLDALRTWVAGEAPELLDDATAKSLRKVIKEYRSDFPQWAEYAVTLHEAGGSDGILIAVIEADKAPEHKDLVRDLIQRLADGEARERFLKAFE